MLTKKTEKEISIRKKTTRASDQLLMNKCAFFSKQNAELIIESNKLYDLNMDINSEEKNLDVEAKAWLNITTESANDTTLWFERDLDDFLKELHRESEELD